MPRKGKYSSDRNQPAVVSQAVTIVYRTELGTTLLIGFENTTAIPAYFRCLELLHFASSRRDAPSSSPVWPRRGRVLRY